MLAHRLIAAALILSLTQGCSIVRRELRSSGGIAGDILDRRMFDASSSKQLQLLRYTMIVALASRVGVATIRDAREAEAFVSYLRNTSDELNFLGGHLYGEAGRAAEAGPPARSEIPARYTCNERNRATLNGVEADADTRCDTYQALFESDLPELERKVMRLVVSALPQQQAAQFLRSARGGNVLGAAWHFLRLAAAAADGFHRGAAVYRSSQEILAIAILTAPADDHARDDPATGPLVAARCADAPPNEEGIRTVEDAVRCLGLSREDIFNNPREANIRFPREVGEQSFQALFEIVRTSCGLLPIEVGLDGDQTKQEARRSACAELAFRPRLRFGGRTRWEESR